MKKIKLQKHEIANLSSDKMNAIGGGIISFPQCGTNSIEPQCTTTNTTGMKSFNPYECGQESSDYMPCPSQMNTCQSNIIC